jgi:hypothetical protein
MGESGTRFILNEMSMKTLAIGRLFATALVSVAGVTGATGAIFVITATTVTTTAIISFLRRFQTSTSRFAAWLTERGKILS